LRRNQRDPTTAHRPRYRIAAPGEGGTMSRLDGKIAIVTGAGRGLGRAMATALAERGAKVVAASRTLADLEDLAAQVDGVTPHVTDIAEEASVDALVEATIAAHGRIDIVVNNS